MIGRLWTLAALEVRQALGGAKLLFASLALAALLLLPLVVRVAARPPEEAPPELFWPVVAVMMLNFAFLQTVVLLLPLLLSTSLIRDEVEAGTLVYLVTRPIPRPLLLLAKYAAATALAATLVSVGMSLFLGALLLPGGEPTGGRFDWWQLLADFLLAGLLGVVAYGALFTLVGLVFRRGFIWGLAYGFVSELVLSNIPAVVREATIMYYLRSVALAHFELRKLGLDLQPDQGDDVRELLELFQLAPPATACLTVLALAAVCLGAAALVVRGREFAADPTPDA